jgi:hypothetical protein
MPELNDYTDTARNLGVGTGAITYTTDVSSAAGGNFGPLISSLIHDAFSSNSELAHFVQSIQNRHYSSYTRAEVVTGYQRINTSGGVFSGQDDSTKSSMHFAKSLWSFLHGTGSDMENSVKGSVDVVNPARCWNCTPRQQKARAIVIHNTPLEWFDQNNTCGTILKMAVDDLVADLHVPMDELDDGWIKPNIPQWELEQFTTAEMQQAVVDLIQFLTENPAISDMPVIEGPLTVRAPARTASESALPPAVGNQTTTPPKQAGFGVIAVVILVGVFAFMLLPGGPKSE